MSQDHVAAAISSEDRRFAAMAASDIGALEQVLADDLHYTHANGMVEDKTEFIRRIVEGERRYQQVRLIGRTAVAELGFVAIFGKLEVEVMRKAGLLVNQLEYTAIYRDGDPRLFIWSAAPGVKP